MNNKSGFVKVIIVLSLLFILDRILKYLAVEWSGVFIFRRGFGMSFGIVKNNGLAFSIDFPLILIILLTILSLAYLWLFYRGSIKNFGKLPIFTALMAVFGGGISNMIDRVFYGYVIDYLSLYTSFFNIAFNIADMMIIGAVVLLIANKTSMSLNPSIFHAYDIRGLYPDVLYPESGIPIGREFATLLGRKYNVEPHTLNVVIGYDVRHGSRPIADFLIQSLVGNGVEVTDVGLISTDMIYFAVGKLGYDGGIMVTASHNPKEYAGIKFVGRGVEGIDGENGLYEMRDKIVKSKVKNPSIMAGRHKSEVRKGTILQTDIMDGFVEYVLSFIDVAKIKPIKVVVDAGNGSAAKTWSAIVRKLPIKMIPIFFELSGDFPGRGPNSGSEGLLKTLKEEVKKQSASVGFAFDGDADRVFLVDDEGAFVNGSVMIALIAEGILHRKPDATILYNVTGGRIIKETVEKYPHARAIITPVGHSKIKRLAKENKADFAGEPQSGHYFFKENFYADSAVIFALKVLELLSTTGKPLSELVAPYKKYHWSGEMNFKLESKEQQEKSINQLKNFYRGKGKIIEIDGVRFEFVNWWFGARLSNTESFLRLNIEADTVELLEEKRKEVLNIVSLC